MNATQFVAPLGLVVLFLLAYYLRRRHAESVGGRRGSRDEPFSSAIAALEGREYEWTTAFYCPWCGEENDPDFTFCRNCLGELSPGSGGFLSGSGLR